MELKEYKEIIGSNAEIQIARELKITEEGGSYPCCITNHKKGKSARMIYYEDGDTVTNSFYCHDCKKSYDIINHAMKFHKDNVDGYLNGISKGNTKRQVKKVKEIKPIEDFNNVTPVEFFSSSLHDEAAEWLDSRCISVETADIYGVTGTVSECHFNYYIPVDSDDGVDYKLVFIKARALGDMKNCKGKYHCQKGGTPVLYGIHTYVDQKILIICEGEIDCLSFYEGVAYRGLQDKVCVTSVPNGTSHAWISSCKPFISKFQTVIIVSDTDSAGVKFREGCFQKLTYCKDIRWIDMEQVLPKGDKFNDVNDYLRLNGKQKVAQLMSKIEVPHHSCGMSGAKIEREIGTSYVKTGFFGVDRALGGLQMGSLSLLAGESNDQIGRFKTH